MITGYNERSWGIDLIAAIKVWASKRDRAIKSAGGERTLKTPGKNLFPDVLLFGDESSGRIVQGWELKFPDTSINDVEFKNKAKEKADLLGLNSFLLWNVSFAVLYIIGSNGCAEPIKTWNNLSHISRRDQVEGARQEWHNMMEMILRDLADFFERKIIRSTSIVDSLTGEGLVNFILRNTDSVAAELRNERRRNSYFDDLVTLWWRSEHRGYPSEDTPCKALARINLIGWINRFIFAHLLKSFYKQAGRVENIGSNTSMSDAVNIFQAISAHCDFWNVFRPQIGEDKLPSLAWEDLVGFNEFLSEFNLARMEQSLLHKLLEGTVYRGKRKIAGQFATPIEVARLLVYLTVGNKELNVLDPCCGTGTIARAVYDIKKEYGVENKRALASTWASDKFAFPLNMATLALVEPENIGEKLPIFMMDATNLETGLNVILCNPYSGTPESISLPPIHYIVSNLPFVQQEDLDVLNPNIEQINTFIKERTGARSGLDSRSDLYAYLPFYLWRVLEENGHMGVILSNAWLSTDYALAFRHHLRNFFHIEFVLTSGCGKWFRETDVVTNMIVLKRRGKNQLNEDNNRQSGRTVFATIKKSLREIQVKGSLRELASLIRAENKGGVEVSKRSYTNAAISELESLGLGWGALFADCGWLPLIANKLIPANTLFEIRRGERRGWDRMFYPPPGHRIESEYVQRVLKNLRGVDSLLASADADAFCCTRSVDELEAEGHTGALNWIRTFETQVNGKGQPLPTVLRRPGIFWYTMLPNTMADLVASINYDERLFIPKLRERSFVNQRLIRFTARSEGVNIDLCHALLNSIIGIFYIEALGFGRGLGALDLNAKKMRRNLFMLNPELLSRRDINDILSKFAGLLARRVLPIEEEFAQTYRIDFENTVLRSYGILELKERIINSLMTMYKIRKSVT